MKNSLLNKPAFRYIFEIIVIVFSVTLSFYIQKVLLDKEKLELKNIFYVSESDKGDHTNKHVHMLIDTNTDMTYKEIGFGLG